VPAQSTTTKKRGTFWLETTDFLLMKFLEVKKSLTGFRKRDLWLEATDISG
jgi:hypothetical protein